MTNLNCKSALVTGGAGFIGSALCEALVQKGARVTIVDNLSNGSRQNIEAIASQVDFYTMDICTPEFSNFLIDSDFDFIFHLAANAYVPPSVKNPEFDFQVNCAGPFHILDTMRRASLHASLIVNSSAGVYGNPSRLPISETDLTVPVSPYGVSKLAMERYLYVFSQLYGIKAASLRLFSVYGPRQFKQIVFDFITKISQNHAELEILGDGTQVRDLIYVKDVVQALLLVSEHAPMNGEVYNTATGRGYTTRELAEIIYQAMGLEPNYYYTGCIRPGDPHAWIADITKIKNLGFDPAFSLEAGIKKTVEWYQANQVPASVEVK